jgi:hypothetical protein
VLEGKGKTRKQKTALLRSSPGLGSVAQICNPAAWKAEIGSIAVQVSKTSSQPNELCMWHACDPSYIRDYSRRTEAQGQPQARSENLPETIT